MDRGNAGAAGLGAASAQIDTLSSSPRKCSYSKASELLTNEINGESTIRIWMAGDELDALTRLDWLGPATCQHERPCAAGVRTP